MNKSPYSTSQLRSLPSRAYAHYSPLQGWTVVYGKPVAQVVAEANAKVFSR